MKLFLLISVLLSAIFLTACPNQNGVKKDSPGNGLEKTSDLEKQPDQSAKETENESGVCSNDYYPIDASTKRDFRVTGDIPGGYVLSHEIGGDDTFTEIRKFESGLEVKVNWICTDEGLRTAEYNNSASLSNARFKMDTIESSGLTLPKEWSEGKTWTAEYRINANISAGPASGTANGTVRIDNSIVSMNDQVNVAGKDYNAARVDSVIKMNLTMKGRKIPSEDLKMSNWYTKSDGLVKQSANTQFGKTGIEFLGIKQ